MTYPFMLHKPDGSELVVHSDTERDARLAEGWELHITWPPVVQAPEPEPVPAKKGKK